MPYPPVLIDTEEDTRFRVDYDDNSTLDPFGFRTARIYDQGVLIALAEADRAAQIVEALRYAAGER